MTKPKYVVVDSNVWVALHNNTDSLHEQARRVFQKLEQANARAVVSDYVVQEVFTVLSRRINQTRALQFYDFITNNKAVDVIDVNSHFLNQVVNFIQGHKLTKPLGLIDYSMIFFAEFVDCPIASFDKQLVQSAKKVGVPTW